MKPFPLDPDRLTALGLTPEDIAELARTAQSKIDREVSELASVSHSSDAPTAMRCAELGCYYGHRSPYWARWTAVQDARGLSMAERLNELPPRGPRWLALWAHDAADFDTFDAAYTHHLCLDHPEKIGPVAHENSLYFAHLFRRTEFSRILDTFSAFFSASNDAPGTAGYLYERVWFTFASAAARSDIPLVMAEKLILQFPTEGGAWAALAVARAATGDLPGAADAWARATACEYIEEDAQEVARVFLQPKA